MGTGILFGVEPRKNCEGDGGETMGKRMKAYRGVGMGATAVEK